MNKIIAISGSLRKASFNTALLYAVKNYAPANYEIELISITEIPLYNHDDEKNNGIPAVVEQIKDKIANSAGLLISTPEYNNSIPGVLKIP